uniref:Uncharacterized protein LOC113792293 n=1 Tax=Dermatophagoides pteronyssinus TaxID=6956 RepID=A0A6P6Y134_DERPT|nr:uncharacterized protein LOC113792293 [Dermatophagoides pteronyssinus]
MYNKNIFVIIIMIFIIIHQSTTILQTNNIQKRQLQSTIPCGTKYLKETIGLSITNNNLYQFLFINNTIQIIRYDYQKLSENNIDKNDYKLNLIDGEMLNNGLVALVFPNIVEQIMTVIQWKASDEQSKNHHHHQTPIISMAISYNPDKRICIYCLKTFDQLTYYNGHYNQEIDFGKVKTFINKYDKQMIKSTISNENNGILSSVYSHKLSFSLDIIKLMKNYQNDDDFIWEKHFVIDSSLQFINEMDDYTTEQEQQEFTKSFAQVFGQHKFIYGFIDNDRIFLFANQDEKLITFSSNFKRENADIDEEYPFKLQSFKDFFHCNRPLDPVKIDDNKQTTISTTTTVKPQPSTKHDDSTTTMKTITTEKQQPSPSTTTIISTIKTAVTKLPNSITIKPNNLKTTTIRSIFDQQPITIPYLIIILILSILVFLVLTLICLVVYYIQKIKKIKTPLSIHKFLLQRYSLQNSPSNRLDGRFSLNSSILPTSISTTTTVSEKLSTNSSSMISKTPPTQMMNNKTINPNY